MGKSKMPRMMMSNVLVLRNAKKKREAKPISAFVREKKEPEVDSDPWVDQLINEDLPKILEEEELQRSQDEIIIGEKMRGRKLTTTRSFLGIECCKTITVEEFSF